jgi:uncharacterized protein (TIGR02118 family)
MPARFLVIWETPSDEEAFNRHYQEVHIPLAKGLPGLRSYTLGRNPSPIRGEACYLVGELEFDDMEALKAAFASEQGTANAADVSTLSELAPVRSMIYEVIET